jgi:hypothetical protein
VTRSVGISLSTPDNGIVVLEESIAGLAIWGKLRGFRNL